MRRCGLTVAFVLGLTAQANAEQYSEISAVNASYCALFARQMVFMEIFQDGKLTADSDVIRSAAVAHYSDCVSILPTLMPLPPDLGAFDQWVADVRDLVFMMAKEKAGSIGTVPATENTADEEWRRACRGEYNTWDEQTGTVIRRGNPERVRCPCGTEVVCGY